MFDWLRRFDDWLERKDQAANPRYMPSSYAVDIESEPLDDEKPSFDWDARKKAVEVLVNAEAKRLLNKFKADHALKSRGFSGWAATNGNMLIVKASNRFAINMDHLLTVKLTHGSEPKSRAGWTYVVYDKSGHYVRENSYFDPGEHVRYYNRPWPSEAEDDVVTFYGLAGQAIDIIPVPFGQGEYFYSQIMDAIGERK